MLDSNVPLRDECNLCSQGTYSDSTDKALVRSNIARFANERFEVWRCSNCASLHSRQTVELSRYYQDYPMHRGAKSWVSRLTHRAHIKHLERMGLKKGDRVLDFGCGVGALVEALSSAGYESQGFDRYNPAFNSPEILERQYDFIVLQDVLEHVEDPVELLAELGKILSPAGRIYIGTPNGAQLSLKKAETYLHSLHQPFHLHILSDQALRLIAEKLKFRVCQMNDRFFGDTLFPFLNIRFALFVIEANGNTFDSADVERIPLSWRLLTPRAFFFAFFGGFFPTRDQISATLAL
ncbi:class I SAM-dependent methyltransferase [bacterium]|nr:class I SAM-dependent methyltransferase [bacterium]